jgi:hypothetical protein
MSADPDIYMQEYVNTSLGLGNVSESTKIELKTVTSSGSMFQLLVLYPFLYRHVHSQYPHLYITLLIYLTQLLRLTAVKKDDKSYANCHTKIHHGM